MPKGLSGQQQILKNKMDKQHLTMSRDICRMK